MTLKFIDSFCFEGFQVVTCGRKSGGISGVLRKRIKPKTKYKSLNRWPKVKSKTLFKLKPEDLIY